MKDDASLSRPKYLDASGLPVALTIPKPACRHRQRPTHLESQVAQNHRPIIPKVISDAPHWPRRFGAPWPWTHACCGGFGRERHLFYLESQDNQKKMPLNPEVAHTWLTVAWIMGHRSLAFQVHFSLVSDIVRALKERRVPIPAALIYRKTSAAPAPGAGHICNYVGDGK